MWVIERHRRGHLSSSRDPSPGRLLRHLPGDENAATAVEFALVFPLLLSLCFGILDFTLLAFDYHRAGEATRRAARTASIVTPVADLGALTAGAPVVCTSTGGVVSCGGTAVVNDQSFTEVVDDIQTIHPDITGDNVSITYSFTGLGDAATPGGSKSPAKRFFLFSRRHHAFPFSLWILIPFLGMVFPLKG
ncbi:MAG: pilus assembly protein [Alphaproteobacteria bacterium]|nr:pilus assembly protein [Alphaproteobacteria bacterium]